jgi:hypothetical protein
MLNVVMLSAIVLNVVAPFSPGAGRPWIRTLEPWDNESSVRPPRYRIKNSTATWRQKLS